MQIQYTTPNGRIVITQEIQKGKDAFEFIGKVQELFEEEECGCCQSKRIRCETRTADDFKFYQYTCLNPECRARLEFGQHKEGGTLFAKRWDTERKAPMPDNGWFIWQPESDGQPANQGQQPYAGRPSNGPAKTKESAARNEVPF